MAAPLIMLVDDEALVRRAVSRLLRTEGFEVEAFESAEDFLARAEVPRADCLLFDIAMGELSGIDLQQRLAEGGARPPIIFMTGRADVPMTVRAFKGGAIDFLMKPVPDEVLLRSVRNAVEVERQARALRAELEELQERVNSLTPREREVIEFVAKGWLNKQIAAELGTVEKTVKVQRARAFEKMKVRTSAEVARIFERLAAAGK